MRRITRKKKSRKKIKKQKGSNQNIAYVINLDERKDRYEKFKNNFKDYNITLERVSAIRDPVGWKGCGYSHMKVIKMAKELKLPTVLICEDDCIPTEHFSKWFKIKDWLDTHKDKWDIFLGGNSYYGFSEKNSSVKPICKLDSIKLYNTKITSFQFYYINSSSYDKMLEWEEYVKKNNDWIPIDLWPNKIELKSISCIPFIVLQEKGYSNIENTVRDYTPQMKVSEEYISSIPNDINC
jgi:GR25 family glycosyltransferase involved in LPS biosynthesis